MTFERHKVNQRVLSDLKKRSTFGIFFYIALAFVIVISDHYYARHPYYSTVFLLATLGICLFRLVHLPISKKMGNRFEALNKNIFYVSVITTALIWGVAFTWIMFQPDEHNNQMLMAVLVSGLCAGGVVAFIPNRRLSIYFNLSMLMPAAISMLIYRTNVYLTTLIVFFSVYLVIITFRGNKEYWDALENEYLLEVKSGELARLSNTDVLTGLYNRRYFSQTLELEWKRSDREKSILTVIIFDIDHFKHINDTFGHQAGDEYLIKTAAILDSVFKRDYDVVARYGGEEFVVLLPGIQAENARGLAEQVRRHIDSLVLDYQGEKIFTTISAGIMSCIPEHHASSDSIVLCADNALYQAKQTGRNKVIVYKPAVIADELHTGIRYES
jgi:diguanylate cyclase (GGDEF)-like protein